MAEQAKEQVKDVPWLVKVSPEAFLDGAPGAIQANSGILDITTTEAKRAKVQLSLAPGGIEVRYESTRSTGGKSPVTTARRRVFPWPQVKWYDMPAEAAPQSQK